MLGELGTRARRDQGFTLIELLVIVLIVGILATIAVPTFMNAKSAATDSAVQSDVTQLKKAVLAHVVSTQGTYVAVSALKSDGYSGPSVAYSTAGTPSYAGATGPTAVVPTAGSEHFCVAATSPTGTQWFATDQRSVSKVGGGLDLCG